MRVPIFIVALSVACGSIAFGQASAPATHPAPNECLRFAFGRWSTPLDWKTAGHRGAAAEPDPASPRGDASRAGTDSPGDILIYPAWWPVGVYVKLDSTRAVGDTLFGTATALVANGKATVPTAQVRAVRVACGQRPPTARP